MGTPLFESDFVSQFRKPLEVSALDLKRNLPHESSSILPLFFLLFDSKALCISIPTISSFNFHHHCRENRMVEMRAPLSVRFFFFFFFSGGVLTPMDSAKKMSQKTVFRRSKYGSSLYILYLEFQNFRPDMWKLVHTFCCADDKSMDFSLDNNLRIRIQGFLSTMSQKCVFFAKCAPTGM